MKIHHLIAAFVTSLSCTLLTASCVQSPRATPETETETETETDAPAVGAIPGAPAGAEAVGEAQEALNIVNCKDLDVVECMIRCGQAGIPCRPQLPHPYKSEAGNGDLYRCAEWGGKKSCSYHYENGDSCAVISGARWVPCIYVGAL